ncbi:MAG: hypothetical protein K2M84_06520 [Anaeroplasmataceae bacterium]|nr:hypothetical protein [Anaeroplasmataceae bacterium]
MKKIKGLLFAFVGLFAFTLVMVKANAATDYGKDSGFDYVVSTTTNENDTATYDILPEAQVVLEANDTIMGKIIFETVASAKFTTTNASLKVGDQWLVPVPAGSAGKIEYNASSTSNNRNYALKDATGTTTKEVACAKPAVIDFAATDIVTVSGGTYLRFGVVGGELKPTSIKIVLTTGSFEATAQRFEVSYFVPGEDAAFASEEVEGGETALGKPGKWGFNLKGLYTDAELTTPWDKVVTAACNVYCDLEAWDASVIGDGKKLTPALLAKAAELLPVSGNTEVPGTIFTILDRGTYADTALTVNGVQASKVINTGGAFSTKDNARGLAFEATAPGKIKVYLNGNNTERVVSLYTSPTEENQEALASETVAATKDEALLVEFNVPEAGTYAIGGSGTVHIFAAEFVASSVELYQERVAVDAVENIRLVAVVENVDNLSDLSLVLKCALFDADKDLTEAAKLATTVTNNDETYSIGEISFEAKDGVVYIKCVIAADSKYVAETFTAELTVGGITKTVTINALA